jgi:murein DD-endopeptidase MepM/ murein hydrolase activator NlpD
MRFFALFLMLFCAASIWADEGYIEKRSIDFKTAFLPVEPDQPVRQWLLPFSTSDRRDIRTIDVISIFGAHRSSYIKGHKHTGIDIVPKFNSNEHIWVYPIGGGVVCSIHLDHPHITIVVKHKTVAGKAIYSSYKHIFAPLVRLGAAVSVKTKLGRIYTPVEGRQLGGNFDHLHLEIRKTFDDFGVASWATMTVNDLNKRFYDPLVFFKHHL